MNQKPTKVKRETSYGARAANAGRLSLADAFDELRRVRGDEEPIEEDIRADRPNDFTSGLDQPS
ncbi:MAG TPA: hypothetical protein VLF66_11995 [Thermoanaerobaculia bacterium]|nr:hypothetical protein [Thermoanaerobaculia bacterium]